MREASDSSDCPFTLQTSIDGKFKDWCDRDAKEYEFIASVIARLDLKWRAYLDRMGKKSLIPSLI
jgi:hypothetical protein